MIVTPHPSQTDRSPEKPVCRPEMRKDSLVSRWVMFAPDRGQRPINVLAHSVTIPADRDPFAEGNESETPPELLAYRNQDSRPNGPGWRVRVVPNKFPALQIEGDLQQREQGIYTSGLGLGSHEVIIECPHSETNMSRLSIDNIGEVLSAYKHRLLTLKCDPRFVHALIFKNKGALAGASLPHCHSQLMATSFVPPAIEDELDGALQYFRDRNVSIFEDMIQQELAVGTRVVLNTDSFLVFCPFASRCPFETWILPKRQGSHFENIAAPMIETLARVLKSVLRQLECALDDPPYNYFIHSAPLNRPELPYYLWHMELLPRITHVAGFELGTGCFINPILPEQAATILRAIMPN